MPRLIRVIAEQAFLFVGVVPYFSLFICETPDAEPVCCISRNVATYLHVAVHFAVFCIVMRFELGTIFKWIENCFINKSH